MIMKSYEVNPTAFYSNSDGSVSAFQGLSTASAHQLVTIICNQLDQVTYQALLSKTLDALINFGLDSVRRENTCRLEAMQIDLSNAPDRYNLLHILNSFAEGGDRMTLGDRELQKYLEETSLKLISASERVKEQRLPTWQEIAESYYTESDPFSMNVDRSVYLFKGVSADIGEPVIIKRHDLFQFRQDFELSNDLTAAINAGLEQARVQHSNTCKILALQFNTKEAPKRYVLDHVLEAVERDLGREIEERQRTHRGFSECELWSFLQQSASALVFAHGKVRAP